jgi:hypothetical protein
MTLPTNDNLTNRELSIEELEAIAAGSCLGDAWNLVTNGLSSALHGAERGVAWVVNGGHSATRRR